MNDEDKDKINKEGDTSVDENQSQDENTPVAPESSDDTNKEDENTEKIQSENESSSDVVEETASSDQTDQEAPKTEENKKEHEVIHKKDGRLHIYVRQDKYKGELKSKNWVGRLYIDGKQKISSSGTPNIEEAIPILEKWFDDIHSQKEKERQSSQETPKTGAEETSTPPQQTTTEQAATPRQQKTPPVVETPKPSEPTATTQSVAAPSENKEILEKKPALSFLEKIKNIKIKKPSFGKKDTSVKTSAAGKTNIKKKLEAC